jgi:hypothetical protein
LGLSSHNHQPPPFFLSPTFFTCCWFSLDTLICLVVLVCEEVLPSGRRGNPHTHSAGAKLSGPFTTPQFLCTNIFFLIFSSGISFVIFDFFSLPGNKCPRRSSSHRGRLYIFPLSFSFSFEFFYFFLMFILLYASSLENKREKKYYLKYNTTTRNIKK